MIDVEVVLGAGFRHEAELADWLKQSRLTPRLHRSVADMAKWMREADLAVASFGMTAYELAALGVPAVHLCLTLDHAEAALAVVDAGLATSLGLHTNVTPAAITAAVRTWHNQLRVHGFSPRRLIDGRGAMRIAGRLRDRILAAVDSKASALRHYTLSLTTPAFSSPPS